MKLDDLPVGKMGLPSYGVRFLKEAGIHTAGALLRLDRDALLLVPGMGPRTADEIMQRRQAFLAAPEEMLSAAQPPRVDPYPCPTDVPDWLAEKPLEAMGFPSRIHFALKAHGIRTVGDVCRLSTADLASIDGMGRKTIQKVMVKRARLLAGEEQLAPLTREEQKPWWSRPRAEQDLLEAYPDASIQPAPQGLATAPVHLLGLPPRSVICLQSEGVRTFGDLCRLTASDLLHIHGLGPSSVLTILEQRQRLIADPATLLAQVAVGRFVMTEEQVRIEQFVVEYLAGAGHPLPLAQVAAAMPKDDGADEAAIRACIGISQHLAMSGGWCYRLRRGSEASAWTLAALHQIGTPARAEKIAVVMREIAPHLGEIQMKTLRNYLRAAAGVRRVARGTYGLRRWAAGAGGETVL